VCTVAESGTHNIGILNFAAKHFTDQKFFLDIFSAKEWRSKASEDF